MPQGQVVGRISIKVLPDTTEFRDELKDDLRKIERDKSLVPTLKVGLELDTTKLKASLERVKKELEDWRKDRDPLKIGVEVNMLAGQTVGIAARLAYLTRPRTVSIIPKMDMGAYGGVATALAALSGGRVLGDLLENLWDIGKEFDRLVPKIGTFALALGGITNLLLTSVSNISALALSFAQMGSALLAMPGLFGGMAIGAGIFVVALTTMKTQMPELFEVFSNMRDLIGKNFWAEAGQGALALAQQYLPLVGETATRLGVLFGTLGQTLTEQLASALPGMFGNLNSSIDILTGKTGVFASIIKTLGTTGAEYLPRLTTFIGDAATKFDEFLKGASADGSLKTFIEGGIQGFKDMASIIKDAFGVLGDIGKAAQAGGGSTLGILADTMERIRDVTSSPEFQNTLTAVFSTAHDVMSQIADTAGPAIVKLFQALGSTLVTIGPALGEGLGVALGAIASALADPSLQAGIQQVFFGLRDAIVVLAPALAPVAQALGSLAPIITSLLGVLAPLITAALIPLGQIIQILAPPITMLVNVLGGALLQILSALAPALISIAEGLVGLVTAAMPVINVLIAILVPVLKIVIDLLGSMIESIINGLTNAFSGITQIFSGFATMFSGGWDNFWKGIKEVFSGVWDLIKGIIEVALNIGVLGIVKKGMLLIKGVFKGGWDLIKGILQASWDGIKGAFRNFIDVFVTMPSTILSNLQRLFSTVWFNIRFGLEQAWVAIKNAITKGGGDVLKFVGSLPGEATKALGDLGSTLRNAGIRLIQGFIDGIGSMITKVKDTLGNLTSKLTSWKGPESTDKVLLYDAGQLVIGGFIAGLESQYDAVRKSLKGLSNEVGDFTVKAPSMGNVGALVDGGMSSTAGASKVFNYYAAPGNSFSSEEDLFAATGRARMVGW